MKMKMKTKMKTTTKTKTKMRYFIKLPHTPENWHWHKTLQFEKII
jgi:hypothetical protein